MGDVRLGILFFFWNAGGAACAPCPDCHAVEGHAFQYANGAYWARLGVWEDRLLTGPVFMNGSVYPGSALRTGDLIVRCLQQRDKTKSRSIAGAAGWRSNKPAATFNGSKYIFYQSYTLAETNRLTADRSGGFASSPS